MRSCIVLLLLVSFVLPLYSSPNTITFDEEIIVAGTADGLVNQAIIDPSLEDMVQELQLRGSVTSDSGNVNLVKVKLTTVALAICTGLLGGHRLYLGTKPIVPIVYAVTLGGGFGMLPLIDMIVILLSKDVKQYMNNPKILMWIPG